MSMSMADSSMPVRVVILGTGGNCLDILETISDLADCGGPLRFDCVGFLDDNPSLWGKSVGGVRVLGGLAEARSLPGHCFINGIGSPKSFAIRSQVIASTGISRDAFVTVISPFSYVSRSASVGLGVALLPNVTVASNARIGDHVTVLSSTVINHDTVIGAYCCIASGVCVSGGVTVGSSCYLGSNCSVAEGVRIGDGSLIGMGAVVRKDVPPKTVVVGNPARILRVID
jgi:sugar O-acyltransferase (sialic acid O-acetyltransferase NeuD family)